MKGGDGLRVASTHPLRFEPHTQCVNGISSRWTTLLFIVAHPRPLATGVLLSVSG